MDNYLDREIPLPLRKAAKARTEKIEAKIRKGTKLAPDEDIINELARARTQLIERTKIIDRRAQRTEEELQRARGTLRSVEAAVDAAKNEEIHVLSNLQQAADLMTGDQRWMHERLPHAH